MSLLEISNLYIKYQTRETFALSNVSISVNKGEIVLITGPTGCGKSTLVHYINGIIPNVIPAQIEGSIKLNSEEISEWEVKKRAERIGTIFQNPETQLFALVVEDDVAFGPENLALPRQEIRDRVDASLKIVGLSEFKDKFIFHLSGGQKQRLAIAGALAMKPDILLFDEPASDLDPQGTMEIIRAIKRLAREEDKAIILIEHKLQDVIEIIDRMYVMDQGQLVLEGTPIKVFTENLSKIKELGINIPTKFAPKEMRIHPNDSGLSNKEGILTIEQLFFRYTNEYVLKDVSLKTHEEDFIALLGRNGSGKTTLVQNIIGLLRPESGDIIFNGEDIKKRKVQRIARKIGYLFQNPSHQIFLNTVYDELAFGLKITKLKKEGIEARIHEFAEKLNLTPLINESTHTLSRGQSQKVALASILLLEPQLLILDEPTTGQDYRNRRAIMELTKDLNEQGITILLITHDIDLAYEYARRIVILDNGRIIADGPSKSVFYDTELLARAGLRQPKSLEVRANEAKNDL